MKVKYLSIFITMLLCTLVSYGQNKDSYSDAINGDAIEAIMPREKIYIHTDKSTYIPGDTMWLKAYILNSLGLSPSQKSGIIYLDIIGPDTSSKNRIALHCYNGQTAATIPMEIGIYKNGKYTLRAFSKWMLNFGDSLFYTQTFQIIGAEQNWTAISTPFNINDKDKNKAILKVNYHFLNKTGKTVENKPINYIVTDKTGDKIYAKNTSAIDNKGNLDIQIELKKSELQKSLVLILSNTSDSAILDRKAIPQLGASDIQFLPESGHLVAGIPNLVGIKAINISGMGIDVNGKIIDNNGTEVATFHTPYKGMGSVDITPIAGNKYFAILPDNTKISLPNVEASGSIIHLTDSKDSVQIQVNTTSDLIDKKYRLVCLGKTFKVYSADLKFNKTPTIISLSKELFPPGVCHAMLFDETNKIKNERVFFSKTLENDLHFTFNSPHISYQPDDSASLDIRVTDGSKKPVIGVFSIAITDHNQAPKDFNIDRNIQSYLLLESDLHGYIESPNYFLNNTKAMDALLLTQGYIRYNWDTSNIPYNSEPQFEVSGQVVNGFNKGIKEAKVTLFSAQSGTQLVIDTITDNNGNFKFNNLPLFETIRFGIQAHKSSFGLGLKLNRMPWPKLTVGQSYSTITSNMADTTYTTMLSQRAQYLEKYKNEHGFDMEEVIVQGRKRITNSRNLNGNGIANIVVGPDQIRSLYGKSLLDVLYATVKGFGIGYSAAKFQSYSVGKNTVAVFLIDGQQMQYLTDNENNSPFHYDRFDMEQALKSVNASDVKGIEVMTDRKLSESYLYKFAGSNLIRNYMSSAAFQYVFIEITTYAGNGSFAKNTPGIDYLMPTTFSYARNFYIPKYLPSEDKNSRLPDLRPTIYWNPNIITDANGKATVKFYFNDRKTVFDVDMQGISADGTATGAGNIQLSTNK